MDALTLSSLFLCANFSFLREVSRPRCVRPCTHRKLLEMLFSLLKVCELTWYRPKRSILFAMPRLAAPVVDLFTRIILISTQLAGCKFAPRCGVCAACTVPTWHCVTCPHVCCHNWLHLVQPRIATVWWNRALHAPPPDLFVYGCMSHHCSPCSEVNYNTKVTLQPWPTQTSVVRAVHQSWALSTAVAFL